MVFVVLGIILSVAALVITLLVILDKINFNKKLNNVKEGMTGKEIQNLTKRTLKVTEVKGDYYYAILTSRYRFFKYTLTFKNGKLKELKRM